MCNTTIFLAYAGEYYEKYDVLGVFTSETDAVQRCKNTPSGGDGHYDSFWVDVWEIGADHPVRRVEVT